ncbi:putative UPF0157 protein YqkA [Amylocarpus encephaloides]|uniref:UPF0157 protein YqkA n=1 Tax=Amylocarpus encephaloides TaxID=45428 RepID=A0A9P8C994_9HELO|nr:putative UPF0157 protein YqkA [Amylocarpus encephaloides]
MSVVVEPHSPIWSTHFSTVKFQLENILRDAPVISIDHVGSTSIPGLPAKPVLDIDIIVSEASLPLARAALIAGGYTDLGDLGIAHRYAFREPGRSVRDTALGTHEDVKSEGIGMRMNTYVVLEGCLQLRNHLDVKRVLLEDEGLRREYGDTKLGLAAKDVHIEEYLHGKNEVVLKILRRAGWTDEELGVVKGENV